MKKEHIAATRKNAENNIKLKPYINLGDTETFQMLVGSSQGRIAQANAIGQRATLFRALEEKGFSVESMLLYFCVKNVEVEITGFTKNGTHFTRIKTFSPRVSRQKFVVDFAARFNNFALIAWSEICMGTFSSGDA